ncbi:uncharacterized protein LOC103510021 [Diaphorina citri]|uniref:Uncharacterized protein LOC103510021 n=1 Tax=Diaphorina citri TaxID=121845 RepID=A0A1S3D2C0_DIACI|nr:uncharacterized protein LOC103510021 [Diaphorina citri]
MPSRSKRRSKRGPTSSLPKSTTEAGPSQPQSPPKKITSSRRNLSEVVGKLFNNPEYSNLKILVNDDVYYADKILLAVSSTIWDELLPQGALPPFSMSEYRIEAVRNSKSFYTILQYIYGLPINLSELPDDVVVETMEIADLFAYDEFYTDLREYIANNRPHIKVDCYEPLNSAPLDDLNLSKNTKKENDENINEISESGTDQPSDEVKASNTNLNEQPDDINKELASLNLRDTEQ